MLFSTKPDTPGKAAVLARSAQLTEFRWTPVQNITTYTKATGKTTLPAGKELTGIIYSSAEPNDKFITENVTFETLLSATANPNSALYQKDLNGHHNSWVYFGIVCNGLARYAYGIKRRHNTKHWLDVPGIRRVALPGEYTVEDIRLCDSLLAFCDQHKHVALITDILRDEEGVIRQIEVSEAVRPTCKRAQYDVAEYFEKFKVYSLCRYDFVDDVPAPDPVQDATLKQGVPALPTIAVDYGNKSNYLVGEEVVISVFTPGEHTVELCHGDKVVETIPVIAPAKFVRTPGRGYYTVRLTDSGECAEFAVNEARLSYTVNGNEITVKADSCDPNSEIVYMDFREVTKTKLSTSDGLDAAGQVTEFYNPICASLSRVEELTDEEKRNGVITRSIPADAGNFKVYFKNKYGVWVHPMTEITKQD